MTAQPPKLFLPPDTVEQLMDRNPWVLRSPMRDGPINWRHMVALRLRDVEIEPIIPTIQKLMSGMVEITNAKVLREWPPTHDKAAVLQFSDWLARWLEHFRHWFDPIRNLFEPLCSTRDSYFIGEVLDQANGVVWLDYVLEVIDQFQSNREVMRRLGSNDPDLGDRLFDRGLGQQDMRAFNLFALEQYQLFCMTAYIKTAPVPQSPVIPANFSDLFDLSIWEADNEKA